MASKEQDLNTRAVHAGSPKPRYGRALVTPIFQSSVFETGEDPTNYRDVLYPRLNNLPNQRALGAKLAALEGAEDGVVASTGMAAITAALIDAAGGGGHVLVQTGVYGGTHVFLEKEFPRLGMSFDMVQGTDPSAWQSKVRPETRAVLVESISNPLMEVVDHQSVVEFARANELTALIDNTFASPVNFQPISLGYDLVLHSATKYLNGHSDLVAGAVIGSEERVDRIDEILAYYGGTLDAHTCFLLDRGVKTLGLRVERQNANALAIAKALESHSHVLRVNYPGLPSHRDHERARRFFTGCGGMLSFELDGDSTRAERAVRDLDIITYGPSLGGVETLATRPALTSHAGIAPQEREAMGITDGLIRVSVGIEGVEDLIDELVSAIESSAQA